MKPLVLLGFLLAAAWPGEARELGHRLVYSSSVLAEIEPCG
ncbi:MAG: hypothetical protein SCH98_05255 [Deferrisomatales bacterium]|nr:hypothetical protein [Deferrisomatales bacterium]